MARRTGRKRSPDAPQDPEYLAARQVLERGDVHARRALAARADQRAEILYYLAEDEDVDVRRQVARNESVPVHAAAILCEDPDDEVRSELARRIRRLLPDLSEAESARLRERALTVLERLASDQLPKVRALLAEAIKESEAVPKSLVRRLAADVEETVHCPVLQYSPLLDDHDLREIIAAGVTENALTAIARRSRLSEAVADDIAASLEIPAVAALLANPDAQIREETLERIIEQARHVQALHKPLALRPHLSIRAMKRIAGFVASALVHRMMAASKVEGKAAEEILERVHKRIAAERVDEAEERRLAAQARDFYARGMIDDGFVADAIEHNRRELLIQALALQAEVEVPAVRKILKSKSGRAVTALAWAAGLSMRTAFQMQTELALVPPPQLVPAKDGTDYPLDDGELSWQLSYFSE